MMDNWQPVEVRCMIQDILGNEVYAKDDNPNNFGDRTIFYCITIPGENDWVRNCPKANKEEFLANHEYTQSTSTAAGDLPVTCSQQPLQNDENSNSNSNQQNNTSSSNGANPISEREKIMRLSSYLVNWSFPIPSDGKNRSCLIKVYDIKLVENLRVNDVIQVSGFLEPAEFDDDATLLTNKSANQNDANNHQKPSFDDDFEPASDFPHRLVPRVHVQKIKKVKHINPLLPDSITRDKIDVNTVRLAKARLSTFLTQLLGGDGLAAEYIILSLISRIHRREPANTLGQFTVGLSGVKPEMKFLVDKLYEFISKITTHSHHIDMSIASLNTLRFTPIKDHDNNKMIAGTLQLPDGMCLLLNETALTEGQLTAQGTQNLEALGNIIRWQRLTYDFKFHSVQIDTDLKILVISEGKSLLPVSTPIRIQNNDPETINSMKQACDSVDGFLTDEVLNMLRYYITALIEVPEYTIPADVKTLVERNFVDWREEADKKGEIPMTAAELSQLMTTARYLTISRGETVLTQDLWAETRRMDLERKSRLIQPTRA